MPNILTASAVVIAVLAGPLVGVVDSGEVPTLVPDGGAAGGPAFYLPHGDILNVRNIQGGTIDDPNLDIGAGSTEHPGDLVLNYDVGRRVLVYDGRKRLLASFGPRGIVFYRRPKLRPDPRNPPQLFRR